MKKEKISIPILILFFYFLFPISIKGIKVFQYAILYGVSFIGVLLNFKKIKKSLNSNFFVLALLSYILIMFVSVIIPIIYRTNDFTYFFNLLNIAKYSFNTLFLAVLIIKKYKDKTSIDLYLKYYIISCCLLVISTIIFMLIPALKNMWINILDISDFQQKLVLQENYVTRFSIIGFSRI